MLASIKGAVLSDRPALTPPRAKCACYAKRLFPMWALCSGHIPEASVQDCSLCCHSGVFRCLLLLHTLDVYSLALLEGRHEFLLACEVPHGAKRQRNEVEATTRILLLPLRSACFLSCDDGRLCCNVVGASLHHFLEV